MTPSQSDLTVVLLHGLACDGWVMMPLASQLEASGFQTVIWNYPSGQHTVAHHGLWLRDRFRQLEQDPAIEHFAVVAHSMGNIITRAALAEASFSKLTRMVMLAPPNRGSYWADFLGYPMKWLWNTLTDLSTSPTSFVNQLPQHLPMPFGVLAGRFDELVPEWSTHLDGETDHLVVNGMHASILFQPSVAKQVSAFLRNGRFDREPITAHNGAVSQHAAM